MRPDPLQLRTYKVAVYEPLTCGVGRRDGNGEFPVGFWLPIPVPATKKLPRGDPHETI
jgi:hypothetical protein